MGEENFAEKNLLIKRLRITTDMTDRFDVELAWNQIPTW